MYTWAIQSANLLTTKLEAVAKAYLVEGPKITLSFF